MGQTRMEFNKPGLRSIPAPGTLLIEDKQIRVLQASRTVGKELAEVALEAGVWLP